MNFLVKIFTLQIVLGPQLSDIFKVSGLLFQIKNKVKI